MTGPFPCLDEFHPSTVDSSALKRIKRLAKQLRKEQTHLSHCQALDFIARFSVGLGSYHELQQVIKQNDERNKLAHDDGQFLDLGLASQEYISDSMFDYFEFEPGL